MKTEYHGPVVVASMNLAGRTIKLVRPADPDQLLDDPLVIDWNRHDDYMPYWAYVWPAAYLLAEEVGREPWPDRLEGSRPAEALEIGCGLGLAGLVAVARGLRVQFTDYDPAPLDFVVRSAAENGFDPTRFSTRQLDWRNLPDEQHSIILGADVIYEARLVPPRSGSAPANARARGHRLDRQPVPAGRERIPERARGAWVDMPGRGRDGPVRKRPPDRRDNLSSDTTRARINRDSTGACQ